MKNIQKENIKHVWSILCGSSVIDQQTNNLSIHNVLEQLDLTLTVPKNTGLEKEKVGINQPVAIPFPFQLISLFRRTNPNKVPNINVEIELFDPIGLSLQKIEFKIDFPADKSRMRSIISSPSIIVTNTGLYMFKIRIKDADQDIFQEVAEIPIEIHVNKKI